ncbi:hypothetical protein [Streptomyces sp. NRRL S-920]|uniref:hypothetical protein n=1 Tax=Streptomyces sp. NRRL S-920 TaxID=1463921 RepID=UPI0004C49C85|nr:hypothetical protein [Streptomyces sp. NRRL S-920]
MPRPVITCAHCGKEAVHKARGWCKSCYRRWLYCGKPPDGLPPRRVIPCGTTRGWEKHKRDRTPPCHACRTAHNKQVRGHRKKTGKERYYSEWTDEADWTGGQQRAAERAENASTGPDDYRLLLEALGLAQFSAQQERDSA